ncbi:molybdopterin molybdotransferase MoeA [Corynebacterium camporealensis]
MRTYEAHLAAVEAAFPTPRVVTLPLTQAVGLAIADTLTAQWDMPRFPNSQMDGYALPHAQGGTFTVGKTIAAGVDAPALTDNVAVPIMTGARVPENTAAIVPVEHSQPEHFANEGEEVQVPACSKGQFIREQGSDIKQGTVLIEKGARLNPAAIGTLAAQGLKEVEIQAPARILILTGGSEIGGDGPAQIPDSNGPLLAALCKDYGIEVAGFLRTNDDPEVLRRDVEQAIAEHRPDAIVSSGGISHGKFEVVRQVFNEHGWFGHVAQQPGGPQGLSSYLGVPVIALPGNPVSTLVSFRLYVAPILGTVPKPYLSHVTAAVEGLEGKEQFRRAVLYHDSAGIPRAQLVGGAGSHLLAQAIEANGLVRIPADSRLNAGDDVEVHPF